MAELTATMPSTSTFSSNLITAEIRVENLAASSSSVETISIPTSSSSSALSQQSQSSHAENAESDNNNSGNISTQDFHDEPEAKRQKLNTNKAKKFEKLESRLGSVLCCAVCLDLPKKTAMYQVSNYFSKLLP